MSFSYFDGLITSSTFISKIYYDAASNIVSGILDTNNTITINPLDYCTNNDSDFTINAMVIGGGGGGGGKGVFLSLGGYGFNTAGGGGGGGANVLISFPNNLLTSRQEMPFSDPAMRPPRLQTSTWECQTCLSFHPRGKFPST